MLFQTLKGWPQGTVPTLFAHFLELLDRAWASPPFGDICLSSVLPGSSGHPGFSWAMVSQVDPDQPSLHLMEQPSEALLNTPLEPLRGGLPVSSSAISLQLDLLVSVNKALSCHFHQLAYTLPSKALQLL